MVNLLLLLSLIALVGGFFFTSEATMGVTIIGIAAVLAMYARISQADRNHKELKNMIVTGMQLEEEKPGK